MTIHFVDEGVDTGPIILQKAFPDCDPTWSYLTLMQFYADQSPGLIWEAIHRLQQPDFIPIDNMPIESEPVYKFPTVQDARHYRIRLNKRRKH
jgi:methionyl-tRNA formyltransferase